MATRPVQVITTVESLQEAERISRVVLERRQAACVQQIGPIESRYWWEGSIERAKEWVLVFKTSPETSSKLAETIKALHSYDVPEILLVSGEAGNETYLKWLEDELRYPTAQGSDAAPDRS
jgi:periplasmic divalent cation tolerance protein